MQEIALSFFYYQNQILKQYRRILILLRTVLFDLYLIKNLLRLHFWTHRVHVPPHPDIRVQFLLPYAFAM